MNVFVTGPIICGNDLIVGNKSAYACR